MPWICNHCTTQQRRRLWGCWYCGLEPDCSPEPEQYGFKQNGIYLWERNYIGGWPSPQTHSWYVEIQSLEKSGSSSQPDWLEWFPTGVKQIFCDNHRAIFGSPFNVAVLTVDAEYRQKHKCVFNEGDLLDVASEFIPRLRAAYRDFLEKAFEIGNSRPECFSAPDREIPTTQDSHYSLWDVLSSVMAEHEIPETFLWSDWKDNWGWADVYEFQEACRRLLLCLQMQVNTFRITQLVALVHTDCLHILADFLMAKIHINHDLVVRNPDTGQTWESQWRHEGTWGAGILAFLLCGDKDANTTHVRICIVEKRDGTLSFPKGAVESSDTSLLGTALREWAEETNLTVARLHGLCADRFVEDRWCRYFVAQWRTLGHEVASWHTEDDTYDRDPVVRASWMKYEEALHHPELNKKRKEMLRLALHTYACCFDYGITAAIV